MNDDFNQMRKVTTRFFNEADFIRKLEQYVEDHIETLDNEEPFEPYGTERSVSTVILDDFVKWVRNG